MAKDTLRLAGDATRGGLDQMKPGTVTGTSAKGYQECECDGSSYNKYGNRVDLSQLAEHTFK